MVPSNTFINERNIECFLGANPTFGSEEGRKGEEKKKMAPNTALDKRYIDSFLGEDPTFGSEEAEPDDIVEATDENNVRIGKVRGLVIKLNNEFQAYNAAPSNTSLSTLSDVVFDVKTELRKLMPVNSFDYTSFTKAAMKTAWYRTAAEAVYNLLEERADADDLLQTIRPIIK